MAFISRHTGSNVRKHSFEHVRPAKILIRLRIRAVWSESSLGAFWIAKDAKFLHTIDKDSDQIAQMSRLIWVFVGRIYQKVRCRTLQPKYDYQRLPWYVNNIQCTEIKPVIYVENLNNVMTFITNIPVRFLRKNPNLRCMDHVPRKST